MIKYLRHPKTKEIIYYVRMSRTPLGNYRVDGGYHGIGTPLDWDLFPSWFEGYKFLEKIYRKYKDRIEEDYSWMV